MHSLLPCRSLKALLHFLLVSVWSLGLVLGWALLSWTPPAQAQLPALSVDSNGSSLSPPSGVSRYGEYETATIHSPLDHQRLFDVTSRTIFDRSKIPEGKLPVEVRAQEVTDRLWRVFSRATAAKETPVVTVATLNNRPIIQISDDQLSRPVRLVTVTEPDSDFNGKTLDELATEWQTLLQAEVVRFKQLTEPELLKQRLRESLQVLLGLLVASAVIWFLRRLLERRQQTLEARYQQQLATIAEAEKAKKLEKMRQADAIASEETEAQEIADWRSHFLVMLQQQFSVKRQLDADKFLKWVLLWIFILMWYIGIARIVAIVPVLMRWSIYVWATPLALLVIWFGVSLAIRVSKSLIDRFLHSWRINPLLPLAEAQRIALRSSTIAEALKGLLTFLFVIVGIISTLSLFDIPTSSILAGGAILGLAISFGSQSLVKDLVNGCLILIEDQFAVGDVVKIGNLGGLVENLNLRVTQLRNGEGELITIPNSNISNVSNLTRLWSRIDFSIVVAYENDPVKVLNVLRHVSKQLYSEPEWRDRLQEPPDVLGIDDLSHTGMLVRVWIKTAPMEQWSVGREFRLRVRQAFEANNIQIGKPQWIVHNTDLPNASNGASLSEAIANSPLD